MDQSKFLIIAFIQHLYRKYFIIHYIIVFTIIIVIIIIANLFILSFLENFLFEIFFVRKYDTPIYLALV